jgi:uncharacterized membrane protein
MLCIDVALRAVLIFSLENFLKEKKQFNREFSAKKKVIEKKERRCLSIGWRLYQNLSIGHLEMPPLFFEIN